MYSIQQFAFMYLPLIHIFALKHKSICFLVLYWNLSTGALLCQLASIRQYIILMDRKANYGKDCLTKRNKCKCFWGWGSKLLAKHTLHWKGLDVETTPVICIRPTLFIILLYTKQTVLFLGVRHCLTLQPLVNMRMTYEPCLSPWQHV